MPKDVVIGTSVVHGRGEIERMDSEPPGVTLDRRVILQLRIVVCRRALGGFERRVRWFPRQIVIEAFLQWFRRRLRPDGLGVGH